MPAADGWWLSAGCLFQPHTSWCDIVTAYLAFCDARVFTAFIFGNSRAHTRILHLHQLSFDNLNLTHPITSLTRR